MQAVSSNWFSLHGSVHYRDVAFSDSFSLLINGLSNMIHSMWSASKTQDGSPSLIRLVWCLHFSSVYIMDVATYTVRQQLPQTRVADLRFSPRATVLATWGPYFGKSPGSPVHTAWSLVVGADGVIVTHTSQFRAFSFLFVLQQGDFLLDSLVSAVCLSLDSEWPSFFFL